MSWDGTTVSVLGLAVMVMGQIIATVVFMVRTANRAEEAIKDAAEAKAHAERAQKRADDAHEKLALLHAEHLVARDQFVRNEVMRDALREVKDEIKDLGGRIDKFLEERLMGAITRLGDLVGVPERRAGGK